MFSRDDHLQYGEGSQNSIPLLKEHLSLLKHSVPHLRCGFSEKSFEKLNYNLLIYAKKGNDVIFHYRMYCCTRITPVAYVSECGYGTG
jgi:hypothetical protein